MTSVMRHSSDKKALLHATRADGGARVIITDHLAQEARACPLQRRYHWGQLHHRTDNQAKNLQMHPDHATR